MSLSGALHLLSVPEALAQVLGAVPPLGSETIDLESAFGRVLAEPAVCARAAPPFPASAMDGYAIRRADAPGCLTVVGASTAGASFQGELQARQALRIFTGAAVPRGADWVVPQERTQLRGGMIEVGPPEEKSNIRPLAGDYEAGAVVLKSGVRLDGVAMTAAATAGEQWLQVARRPRVAILTPGNELVLPGGSPRPDQYSIPSPSGLWRSSANGAEPFAGFLSRPTTSPKLDAWPGKP